MNDQAVVVGAGVGGLGAARGLQKAGWISRGDTSGYPAWFRAPLAVLHRTVLRHDVDDLERPRPRTSTVGSRCWATPRTP